MLVIIIVVLVVGRKCGAESPVTRGAHVFSRNEQRDSLGSRMAGSGSDDAGHDVASIYGLQTRHTKTERVRRRSV